MEFDSGTILVVALALVAAVLFVARSGGRVADKLTDFQRAVGEARELVLAAEQLWQTGRLEKDDRFNWTMGRLTESFPNLDEETLVGSIEAAVGWMKILRGRE